MRAIKFRAWDNVKNAMYYPGEEDLMLFMLADEGFRVDEVIPDDSNSEGFYAERLEHLQFMQFTGLHDKNGVEIYEGDILTAEFYPFQDDGEPNYHGVIEWIDELSSFYMTKRLANSDKRGISDGISEQIERIDEFEVIGNIYENPNLLEVPSC